MGKVKILHVIDGGFLGGGQANILSICNNIDRAKFEVSIAAKGGEAFEAEARKAGIAFYPVELPKFIRSKYLKGLIELQLEKDFDLIHTHGGVGGYYGRTLRKHIPGLKTVHTIHGIHYLNNENIFVRSVSKTIEQYLVQYTGMTICETNNDLMTAVKNKIADENKSIVIPNGINITKYSNLKKNIDLSISLGLTADNFVIGNISRFDVQKNQKLIIQAAYYLTREFPDMRFILVGAGKTLKSMQEYTRELSLDDHVIFTGEVTNLADYYSIFDIFVFPTLWEGMPFVLLEAMAARKAIICSRITNIMEVVKDKHSALLIDPQNMDELFNMIYVLFTNAELRERIAENAMLEATEYDETVIIKKIEEVYAGVLNN